MPSIRSSKEDALTEVEVSILLSGCIDTLDNLVVRLPLFAGLRIGEVAHLKPSWLDWEKGVIIIPSRQQCGCFECRTSRNSIWSPKTRAGKRSLIITPELELYLTQLPADGINRTRRALQQRFERIRHRSGLSKVCYPHACRATFATRLAEQGISAVSLCYLMGWESLDTAEHYVQSSMKLAHQEFNALTQVDEG
ncbi:MAG: site-specific integrase [Deltaproteobacteria bacterium]|nr:site-specific integrase [Deltaproteobacteria bacterium]